MDCKSISQGSRARDLQRQQANVAAPRVEARPISGSRRSPRRARRSLPIRWRRRFRRTPRGSRNPWKARKPWKTQPPACYSLYFNSPLSSFFSPNFSSLTNSRLLDFPHVPEASKNWRAGFARSGGRAVPAAPKRTCWRSPLAARVDLQHDAVEFASAELGAASCRSASWCPWIAPSSKAAEEARGLRRRSRRRAGTDRPCRSTCRDGSRTSRR